MLCIASTSSGNLRLAVKSSMQSLNARIGINTPGTSEIQRITIGGSATSESQVSKIHMLKNKSTTLFFCSVLFTRQIHR